MPIMPEQVAFEQIKQEVARVINYGINDLHLPIYQAAIILKDLYNEAQMQAQLEYNTALQKYNTELQKEQEQQKEQN